MQKFPSFGENQVALMRSDGNTGTVLDEKFNIPIDDSQIVFTVFNSVKESLDMAKNILTEHQGIECTIYDKDREALYFLRSLKDYFDNTQAR